MNLLDVKLKDRLNVIWSTSLDVDVIKPMYRDFSKKKNFTIGYVGTADYAKLSPCFLDIVKSIDIPNARFEFYSNDSQKKLIAHAESSGIAQKILFKGQAKTSDLAEIYSSFDIMLYPLNSRHFGTCEQVLGEAMSYGVVPVVLDNKPETCIVKNLKNGIVAHSYSELSDGISLLYENRGLLCQLSKNAVDYARNQYSVKNMVHEWNTLLQNELHNKKQKRCWKKICGSPEWLYAYSHGKNGECFFDYLTSDNADARDASVSRIKKLFKSSYSMYISNSKGSVQQYLSFWPKNDTLKAWKQLLENI